MTTLILLFEKDSYAYNKMKEAFINYLNDLEFFKDNEELLAGLNLKFLNILIDLHNEVYFSK